MEDTRIRKDLPNSSGLFKEEDGWRGLLVPTLWFHLEFGWRREVHSGSLLHGHHKAVVLKKMHYIRFESCFIGAKRALQPWRQHLRYLLESAPKGRGQGQHMWFWWNGSMCSQAHIFFFSFCIMFLLVMTSSCHHEGFSRYEEIKELGS